MRYIKIFTFLLAAITGYSASGAAADIPVLPKPQVTGLQSGHYHPSKTQAAIRLSVADTTGLFTALSQAEQMLHARLDRDITFLQADKPLLWMGYPQQDKVFAEVCRKAGIWPEARIGTEGYSLRIEKQGILLAANTSAGLFYGVQTLKQLFRASAENGSIPCLKIVDWPVLRYRGVLDDISRGPVPTLDFMKYQVRRLSEMKVNFLNYYIENVVKTVSHGDFAPAGGSISIDEWRELSDYAVRHHVQLAGNFQSLGHFEKIMAYPQYRHLGETDRMLSPVLPEAFRFLQDIYGEMAPAFASRLFNVNCDETWDLGRGASKRFIDSLGIGRVYADHVIRIHDELKKLGKRTMVWGDIVLQHHEILDMLPKDIVMGGWDYSPSDSFLQFIKPLKEAGFDFFFSPGVLNSNRLMPDFRMTVTNIHNFTRDGVATGAMGMLNTVWDDGGVVLFSIDWYGLACGAEQGWNVNNDPEEEFDKRFNRAVYGDDHQAVSGALHTLTTLTDLAPTQEMNEAVFWKILLPPRGETLQLSLADWDSVRQIARRAENILESTTASDYTGDIPVIRFFIDQYRYMADARFSILQVASDYRDACRLQTGQRGEARRLLVRAAASVESVRSQLTALKEQFGKLWLRENHIYWLDRVSAKYDERIADLASAESLLEQAIAGFEKGDYLPPPDNVRLAVEETTGHYFQYWLLCGPFPNVDQQGRSIDYLQPMGGEPNAAPIPGTEFKDEVGKTFHWSKYESPAFSGIDLKSVFEENTRVLVYAYSTIESPVEQTVRATLGSNDGIRVFLNGKAVFTKYEKRDLIPDEDEVMLPLKEGKNRLLLKIDQNKGGWGFAFRLPDNTVRNHKYKYKILK